MTDDALQTLRTIIAHRDYLRLGLLDIRQELERRSLAHDLSKLNGDEFDGFTRINRVAREHPYDSEEYRASLRQEKPTIDLHYSRNSHHPEYHCLPLRGCVQESMDFLDIIEMVCDWFAAYKTYGSRGTWGENMAKQQERFADTFSDGQWWLIDQVSILLFVQNSNREG